MVKIEYDHELTAEEKRLNFIKKLLNKIQGLLPKDFYVEIMDIYFGVNTAIQVFEKEKRFGLFSSRRRIMMLGTNYATMKSYIENFENSSSITLWDEKHLPLAEVVAHILEEDLNKEITIIISQYRPVQQPAQGLD